MNFNSFNYILFFLPIVFAACALARRLRIARGPQVCLLVASLVFYAWGKPAHLAYLVGSIAVNWVLARLICSKPFEERKPYLVLGLVLNIGFLCTFKYVNFFLSNIPYFSSHPALVPNLAFPLGISFFTLSQINYLVDCYEELMPASNLFDHATFVSFFPYVISGPVSRARRVVPQFSALNGSTGPSAEMIARAMYLFSLGLIKKVVVADSFSKAADYGFNSIAGLSTVEAWSFAAAYALQIYFDFSGYSDMAIASAMFFGIELPRNFDAPFRATSIIEYWQRWHISLTSFITTYIYTPILHTFSKVTLFTSGIATLLAMTIAGLWHGPAWTFVIFGAIHGLGLAVNQYWRKKKMPKIPAPLAWIVTFGLALIAFVFFRAPTLPAAGLYLSHMFGWHQGWHDGFGTENLRHMNGEGLIVGMFWLVQGCGIVAAFYGKSTMTLSQEFKPAWFNYAATVACALVAFLYINSNVAKPFVYFAF